MRLDKDKQTFLIDLLNLHFQSGFLFALPYIAQFLVTIISGLIVDRIRARKTFSITTLRKTQTVIGNKEYSWTNEEILDHLF